MLSAKFHPREYCARENSAPKLFAILALLSAIYYSYVPFLYVLNIVGIEKNLLFLVIIFSALVSLSFSIVQGCVRITAQKIALISLYLFFAFYSVLSFIFHKNYLGDQQVVIVLSLLNPLFIILAVFSVAYKKTILRILFILSSIYFFALASLALQGRLFSHEGFFLRVFDVLEKPGYQNITQYLGLFTLLLALYVKNGKFYFNAFKWVVLIFALVFMFAVGGRAAIISTLFVMMLAYWVSDVHWSSKVIVAISSVFVVGFMSFVSYLPIDEEVLGVRRFSVLFDGDDRSHRIFLFKSAVDLFLLNTKNFIVGAGMNYFPVYTGWMGTGGYPHNLVLELLSEYGIIGFCLFSIPLLMVFYFRKKYYGSIVGKNREERMLFFVFIYLLIISMFTGGLRSSWMLMYFGYLLFPSQILQRVFNRPLSKESNNFLGLAKPK